MNKTLHFATSLINNSYTDILEFGVYSGTTLRQLVSQCPDNNIYGFDSFRGLPEDWVEAGCPKERFDLKGQIPVITGATIYDGWFEDTIPTYLKIAQPIALLHIDCDLYSSTKTVLYSLAEYILPNTIIVFDEWYYNHRDIPQNRLHEQKAFKEWATEYKISYKEYPEIENERRIIQIL